MNISSKVSILLTFLLNLPTYERQGIHICPTLGGALEAIPFRDAYKTVGIEVNEGKFRYQGADGKTNGQLTPADLKHSSMGSIGNLCTEQIKAKMDGAARF